MATLFDLAQTYLNQALPSIDPIFSNTGITSIQPTAAATVAQPTTVGLTPEQLRLLYGQQSGGGSDEFRGGGAFLINTLPQTQLVRLYLFNYGS